MLFSKLSFFAVLVAAVTAAPAPAPSGAAKDNSTAPAAPNKCGPDAGGPVNGTWSADTALTTDKCKTAYGGRPLVQYAAILDAGSTGTRVHIYKFNNCKKNPEVEVEIYKKVKPGLSSFTSKPQDAANSVKPLLSWTMEMIPKELHAKTPIALKATAGLRMLDKAVSQKILDAVHTEIKSSTDFLLPKDPVVVMGGDMEGVYAWWSLNVLLGDIDDTNSKTVGTIEMGGASTQFAFLPATKVDMPADLQDTVTVDGKNRTLYTHSYLGFGEIEARTKVFNSIVSDAAAKGQTKVSNPCFNSTFSSNTPPENTSNNKPTPGKVTVTGTNSTSTNNFDQCYQVVKAALNLNKTCEKAPCAFDGISQPDLKTAFPDDRGIYLLSSFYDNIEVFSLGESVTINDLKAAGSKLCQHDRSLIANLPKTSGYQWLVDGDYGCVDMVFSVALLQEGFKISPTRKLYTADSVNGFNTGWTLSAAIDIIENQINV